MADYKVLYDSQCLEYRLLVNFDILKGCIILGLRAAFDAPDWGGGRSALASPYVILGARFFADVGKRREFRPPFGAANARS